MPLPVVQQKILINSGPSSEGWSSIEPFSRCERLFFLTRVLPRLQAERLAEQTGTAPPPADRPVAILSDPLVRGSIGHVGLAHEYARRAAVARKLDPEMYYDRDTAMVMVSRTFGETGERMLEVVKPVIDDYFAYFDSLRENWNVVAVESPVRAVLADGRGITQRLDLVIQDRNGLFWIIDHKIVRSPTQVDRYTLSGQFLLMHHFGRSYYQEKLGGVLINLLGVDEDLAGPARFKRTVHAPAPAALASFPGFVIELRARIAAKNGLPGSAYLPAFNEQTCVTAYGLCSQFATCQWDFGLYHGGG